MTFIPTEGCGVVKQIVSPLPPEYFGRPVGEWPTVEVEPCTKYQSCRVGKANLTCGECMRIDNPPEPVKVRVSCNVKGCSKKGTCTIADLRFCDHHYAVIQAQSLLKEMR